MNHIFEWVFGVLIVMQIWLVARFVVRLNRHAAPKDNMEVKTGEAANDPTISVCIPARNEMHALTECLERVIASDYKKLEILVLDDQSNDDTSVLIKSFAHAGVRFIAGKQLPNGWLGKNYALETLAAEASGSIILFMDIDTSIEPTTISRVASVFGDGKYEMVSVIPERSGDYAFSMIFGHLRYFWELMLSSRQTPASSSALWAIDHDCLKRAGGFSSINAHTQPESVFARSFDAAGTYRCFTNKAYYGVRYAKRWSSQIETSERLLLPRLTVSFGSFIVTTVCLLSWTGVAAAIVIASLVDPRVWWESTVAYILGAVLFYLSAHVLWDRFGLLSLVVWPYTACQEALLVVTSTLRYATHTVKWKGRSITAENRNVQYLAIDE